MGAISPAARELTRLKAEGRLNTALLLWQPLGPQEETTECVAASEDCDETDSGRLKGKESAADEWMTREDHH